MNIDRFLSRLLTFAAIICLGALICSQGGCATIEGYCDNHGPTCATIGTGAVFMAAVVIVHKVHPPGVQVKQQQPSAPITVPGCVGTACAQ